MKSSVFIEQKAVDLNSNLSHIKKENRRLKNEVIQLSECIEAMKAKENLKSTSPTLKDYLQSNNELDNRRIRALRDEYDKQTEMIKKQFELSIKRLNNEIEKLHSEKQALIIELETSRQAAHHHHQQHTQLSSQQMLTMMNQTNYNQLPSFNLNRWQKSVVANHPNQTTSSNSSGNNSTSLYGGLLSTTHTQANQSNNNNNNNQNNDVILIDEPIKRVRAYHSSTSINNNYDNNHPPVSTAARHRLSLSNNKSSRYSTEQPMSNNYNHSESSASPSFSLVKKV
jgi:hypothetical protein